MYKRQQQRPLVDLHLCHRAVFDVDDAVGHLRPVSYTHLDVYKRQVIFFLVKSAAVLVADFGLRPLPDRHHAVDGLGLGIGLVGRLFLAVFIDLVGFDGAGFFHVHDDGEADIVGVFFDDALQ